MYLNNKYKKFNATKAAYTDRMFNQMQYAILKPVFGSIKDCIKNIEYRFFLYIDRNYIQEFLTNALALRKKNLGFITKSLLKSYNDLKEKKFTKYIKLRKHLTND